MSSQIVFLFDLDQCLPLEQGLDNDQLEHFISKVKEICLSILASSSSLDGPDASQQNVAHFSFRFYSSTEYFMVPDQHEGQFQELSEENFDALDTALSDKFEALLQTSKTNSFNSKALHQHISSLSGHKPQFLTLQKALEEIAVLYNWDRPLMHSPVKTRGKFHASNALYVFTKLPNSHEELCQFLGKPKIKRRFNHKDIFDKIFNTRSRSMLNVFKGDALINVNFIDTSSYRLNVQKVPDLQAVKSEFKKCLFQLHGNVIPVEAFGSNPHSTAAILSSYIGDHAREKPRSAIQVHLSDDILVSFNSTPESKELDFHLLGFVRHDQSFLKALDFENSLLLWPKEDSKALNLARFMSSKFYAAFLKSSDEDKMALLTTSCEESVLQLDLLSPQVSKIVALFFTKDDLRLEQPSKLDLQSFYDIKPVESEVTNPCQKFDGSIFESSSVPQSKCFSRFIDKLRGQKPPTDSEMMKALQKSYLPHHRIDEKLKMRRKTSTEESVNSVKSQKSSSGNGNASAASTKSRSRGAELMRLGSKNAELRRNSREDSNSSLNRSNSTLNRSNSIKSGGEELAKEQWKKKFQSKLKSETQGSGGDDQSLLKKLIDLQIEMLDHGENVALAALAETVITTLLERAASAGQNFEELVMRNFLIDTSVVSKRRANKAVRTRDHKLQVLFRIEFHFFLANQAKQADVEEGMLAHLRQISIWDSANEMLTFLQEIIVGFYISRQPELLCYLYEELDQPPPPGLSELFSPFKRSSEASASPNEEPSSVFSDVSYFSNCSSALLPGTIKTFGSAQTLMQKRMNRMSHSRCMMQIDIRDKKRVKVEKVKTPKAKTPKRAKKIPAKKGSQVRRNLTFDDNSQKNNRQKTPKKTPKSNDLICLMILLFANLHLL